MGGNPGPSWPYPGSFLGSLGPHVANPGPSWAHPTSNEVGMGPSAAQLSPRTPNTCHHVPTLRIFGSHVTCLCFPRYEESAPARLLLPLSKISMQQNAPALRPNKWSLAKPPGSHLAATGREQLPSRREQPPRSHHPPTKRQLPPTSRDNTPRSHTQPGPLHLPWGRSWGLSPTTSAFPGHLDSHSNSFIFLYE